MKTRTSTSWGIRSELNFIKNMGYSKFNRKSKLGPADALKNYIEAADNRDDWDGIKKTQAIEFAKEVLRHRVDYLKESLEPENRPNG